MAAPIPSRLSLGLVRWAGRVIARLARLGAAAVALLAVTGSGCVGLEKFRAAPDAPPAAPANQVVVLWNRNVVAAPDPVNGGEQRPGLMGRMYLYAARGEDISSVASHGTLVVDLYDETPRPNAPAPNPNAPPLEEWRFDQAALNRVLKKDSFGWGYTICLPWGSYRPDVAVVRLTARYEPAGGGVMYAPAAPITLDHSKVATLPQTALTKITPAPNLAGPQAATQTVSATQPAAPQAAAPMQASAAQPMASPGVSAASVPPVPRTIPRPELDMFPR